jgi:transcriptional repressor NrdR
MRCLFCNGDTKVTNKRDAGSLTRRRRECLKCKKRFTTHEQPELKDIIVIKKGGVREVFDASKVKNGIIKACEKRPVSIDKIEKVVADIEAKLRASNKKEIRTKTIGEAIIRALKKLDKVAYIRFASVYREFKDINDFKKEIRQLKK